MSSSPLLVAVGNNHKGLSEEPIAPSSELHLGDETASEGGPVATTAISGAQDDRRTHP